MSKSIRNVKGPSSYFRGVYERYGKYQWNVKLLHLDVSELELDMLHQEFLGYHKKLKNNNRYGFEVINDLLGREVESFLAGRSGGWLVVDDDLSDKELEIIDKFVCDSLKIIPQVLEDERQYSKNYDLE